MISRLAMRSVRAASVGIALAISAGFAVVPSASAAPYVVGQRSIDGSVHDANDAPVPGAVVYLKDSKSLAVKSYLSDTDGNFHFGQLSQSTDYELYAEFGGKRSKSKSISSFDSKNSFTFVLKVDATK